MLSLPPAVRIWLCTQATDLRKSFDGLAAVVRDGLGHDPLSGHVFAFRNKSGDRVKLLVWDEDGFLIWYKRLEAGVFRFPAADVNHASVVVRASDLRLLLDGVDPASVRRSKRYRRSPARSA